MFNNGKQNVADFAKWLKGVVFELLKNQTYFWKLFVDGLTIAWSNGADHCARKSLS
ncbi:MAG: DUF2442 domain-containing protein [Acidobacteriota bacterium]|nr:DUF2442 domain-containing protein [Acidobacteriota bacterium]